MDIREKASNLIGSVFPGKYNIHQDIEKLQIRLAETENILDLKRHSGWSDVRRILIRSIDEIDVKIIALCAFPVKNEKLIINYRVYRDSLLKLISVIEGSSTAHEEIEKRIEQKTYILEEITSQRDPFTGQSLVDKASQ